MTTSDMTTRPTTAFVWVWLPGAASPVPAGRLLDQGSVITFTYGRTYLDRPDAISLYEPELPLKRGEMSPVSGQLAGCIADAAPDAWGRRVIEHRRATAGRDLSTLEYLLESGSDRIGALDFQTSPDDYRPRTAGQATLDELATAAERVEEGAPLTPALDSALLHGSSVGGARPKALLTGENREVITKFSSTTDSFPVVKAEFIAMKLARRVGLNVAAVAISSALGKDVLVVDRFDRTADGARRIMVSALTILELHDADGMAGRYATYTDLAHHVRAQFTDPAATLRELFARITFNVLVGNTDDHARNHAAFWDGHALTLTPAYDICPQNRTGGAAAQAMAYGENGQRASQIAGCITSSSIYHLSRTEAREIIDHQVEVIRHEWDDVCNLAQLPGIDRERLWGRQFLNDYAFQS